MAHLSLQLGTVPLIPFPSRRRGASAGWRVRALLEAALVSSRRTPDHALLDAALLLTPLPAIHSRRRVPPVWAAGAGR